MSNGERKSNQEYVDASAPGAMFVYWTADGVRHEAPFTILKVPDDVTLGPAHSRLYACNEDTSHLQPHGPLSGPVHPREKGPRGEE
jgi:hypothetical protein